MKREPIHHELYALLCTGQDVILDEGFENSSIVKVVKQTPKRMYTTVTNGKNEWEVMTYRLKPCA